MRAKSFFWSVRSITFIHLCHFYKLYFLTAFIRKKKPSILSSAKIHALATLLWFSELPCKRQIKF